MEHEKDTAGQTNQALFKHLDPDLQKIIDAWPTLTPEVRARLVKLVEG